MDRISALMDGELDERQAGEALARLRQNSELRRVWDTFHLIGDALRGERMLHTSIAGTLSSRLAAEPTVLAPRRRAPRSATTYALSAAASIAAIGFVGWIALSPQPDTPVPQELASAPKPTVVVAPPVAPLVVTPVANVPDEGRRNEYLLAHQGFSPSTAIQGVAPYIRSVSTRQPYKDR